MLNSLVQSVLSAQQDNEKQNLELLQYKRTLTIQQRNMEKEKASVISQKILLSQVEQEVAEKERI